MQNAQLPKAHRKKYRFWNTVKPEESLWWSNTLYANMPRSTHLKYGMFSKNSVSLLETKQQIMEKKHGDRTLLNIS